MTEVKHYSDDHKFILEIRGHSGYAESGKDIVCAAVSTLMYALASYVSKSKCESKVNIRNGYAYISCKGAMEAYKTVMEGYNMLSESYPENVQLIGCTLQDFTTLI